MSVSEEESGSLCQAVHMHLQRYFAAHQDNLPESGLYERIIQEIERVLLEQTLQATGGNQLKAAKILGINRNTLRKKLVQLGIV